MEFLTQLKLEAIKICKGRGHTLTAFAASHTGHAHTAYCHHCDGTVTVITIPYPNEVEIGGPMVAVDCTRNLSKV